VVVTEVLHIRAKELNTRSLIILKAKQTQILKRGRPTKGKGLYMVVLNMSLAAADGASPLVSLPNLMLQ
jgi:hypothetical protein